MMGCRQVSDNSRKRATGIVTIPHMQHTIQFKAYITWPTAHCLLVPSVIKKGHEGAGLFATTPYK